MMHRIIYEIIFVNCLEFSVSTASFTDSHKSGDIVDERFLNFIVAQSAQNGSKLSKVMRWRWKMCVS